MTSGLSLQQSPPFSVPARFFVTAPLFGILASLILLFADNSMLLSRWHFTTLAITHCLVLGFFATIMIGALQQILPVIVGVSISRPKRIAGLVYLQWVPGIAMLIGAFMHFSLPLFYISIALITGAIVTFAAAVFISLRDAPAKNETVPGIKLSICALLVTYLLGVILVLGYGGLLPFGRPTVTDLHMAWGLTGWISALIMTVAWQVVPMFQITPPYPRWVRRFTVPVIFLALFARLVLAPFDQGQLLITIRTVLDMIIAAVLIGFALITLYLQSQAKRRVRDVHADFWRLGMINLTASVLLWIAAQATDDHLLYLLAAVAFIPGFAMAIVSGMLLKIVAFLAWLHLQGLRDGLTMDKKMSVKIPRMQSIISTRSSNRLLWILITAELSLVAAVFAPEVFKFLTAVIWLGFFCQISALLAGAIFQFHKSSKNLQMISAV